MDLDGDNWLWTVGGLKRVYGWDVGGRGDAAGERARRRRWDVVGNPAWQAGEARAGC